MDWQQLASFSIVAATAALLIRHERRRRQRANARPCGSDCGCSSSPSVGELKAHTLPRLGDRSVKIPVEMKGTPGHYLGKG